MLDSNACFWYHHSSVDVSAAVAQSVERRIGNAEVGGSIPLGSLIPTNNFISGCGSVWLERRVRDAEVASSNLVTPT